MATTSEHPETKTNTCSKYPESGPESGHQLIYNTMSSQIDGSLSTMRKLTVSRQCATAVLKNCLTYSEIRMNVSCQLAPKPKQTEAPRMSAALGNRSRVLAIQETSPKSRSMLKIKANPKKLRCAFHIVDGAGPCAVLCIGRRICVRVICGCHARFAYGPDHTVAASRPPSPENQWVINRKLKGNP